MTEADDQPTLPDFHQRFSRADATRLMVHHLGLAASFFELTADDRGLEANRLIAKELSTPAAQAASVWVDLMCSWYEDQEEDGA